MGLIPISLGTRSNPARSTKQAGNARLINCFSEEMGEEGKSRWIITATAGLLPFYPQPSPDWALQSGGLFADLDIDFTTGQAWLASQVFGGGVREMIEADGFLYVVAGRQLYRVTPSGEATQIGGIPTNGPVYARRNRRVPTQIAFVSDGYYAVLDTDTLTQVQDPDLPPPTSLAFLDGYGVLPGPNGRYMITSIDDFTQIDGLDEGTAASNPDDIVRAYELEREVYLLGTRSTEAHQNTGDADFPLTRTQTMEVGCAAADSVVAIDTPDGKALAFVAHDHTVRLMRGYTPVVVSNNEVEDKIRRLAEAGTIASLRATGWSWGGRFFYALSCAEWTRVLNAKTGNWHDARSYLQDRWRVAKVIPFAGKLIAGSADSGYLYQLSDEAYSEGLEPHVMEIITPTVHAFPAGGRINALYLDAAAGVGLNSSAPQDLDPVILVAMSKDGGDTWSEEQEIALGRLGQTAKRLRPLYRLGSFDQKGVTFRFRIPAAVQKVVLSAYIDFDQFQMKAAA